MQCFKCGKDKGTIEFPVVKRTGKHSKVCRECDNRRRSDHRRAKGELQREYVRTYMTKYRTQNAAAISEKNKTKRIRHPLAGLWQQINRRPPVRITKKQFLALPVPTICPVLGIPISYEMERENYPSVDRINPNRPYELGNVAIISYRANMIKSIGNSAEHRRIADWLDKFPDFRYGTIKSSACNSSAL